MGRRNSQKKNAAMLDSDDLANLSLSSPTKLFNNVVFSGVEDVQVDRESSLDRYVDALYEKRGSTREIALASIIEAFNSSIHHEFTEKNYSTLLHQCLSSIKKGSPKEAALASHVIGLLALTTGPGEKAQEILEESVSPISEALKSIPETSKILSLLACLAVITFVGGEEPEHTEESMQIMWQVARPKLGPNVAVAKPPAAIISMVVSSWAFLLTTMDKSSLNPRSWQDSMSFFSALLDKDDRLGRIAAGEALALIFEIGSLEKFCGESKVSGSEGNDSRKRMCINGLKTKIINQMKDLSAEAGGRGSVKKDLLTQRNTFRDILDFLENDHTPESSTKIGGELLNISSWSRMIQLNFLKHFLGGGFVKHMHDNPFLHDVFEFTPEKKLLGADQRMSAVEKRMYKSPNSALNKARTQFLNNQRKISQGNNGGYYRVGVVDA